MLVDLLQLCFEAAPPSQILDAVDDACGWSERLGHRVHLGDFSRCLGKASKNRRLQLSGNEAGNGLEMWRQLCREHMGKGKLIEASGRRLLNDFPQCKSMEHLSEHLDKWTNIVAEYGKKIPTYAPNQLQVALMEVCRRDLGRSWSIS